MDGLDFIHSIYILTVHILFQCQYFGLHVCIRAWCCEGSSNWTLSRDVPRMRCVVVVLIGLLALY
jgi:hypothetical protein